MNGKVTKVSIVIPYSYVGEIFKECLRMVFAQKVDFRYEVITIDFSSSNGHTPDFLNGYPIRLLKIKREEFNNGLTRNMGIEHAEGKYVVMMTADALPADEHWLANMIKNFDDDSVAGVYCRQIPREDADVLTKRQLNNWLTGRQKRAINFIENIEDYNALEPTEKLMICTFDDVSSCIRKSVWEKIPFPKTYTAEDLEWSTKVVQAGYKIVYEPGAAVIHSHDRSVFYEYKRTYLCHRKLYELFRLQNVPTLKHALQFSLANIIKDTPYALKHEKSWKRKLNLVYRIPFISFASVFGQYLGARDERQGQALTKFGKDWA